MEGLDYRGIPVIAAIRTIHNSPWFMVARMDTKEAFEPLKEKLWVLIMIIGALLIGLVAGFGFIWKQRNLHFYRENEESLKKLNDELEERVKERTLAIKKSEERYRSTLDNLMEGCQIVDSDYRYVYVNDVAARQGQSTKEELLGYTMMEKYPGIETTLMFTKLRECMISRHPQQMENEFLFKDGTNGCFSLSFEPVAEGVFMLSSDISEHKRAEKAHIESEERLSLFVDNLSDYAIVFLDIVGNITRWNTGAQRIKLYHSDEIIGKNFSVFFTEPDQQNNKPQIMLSKAKSDGQSLDEGWRVRKDGSLFWASVTIVSLKKNDGTHYGFTKITHDLTERKLAEEEFKKLNETLEQKVIDRTSQLEVVNKELEAFTYSVSHDLRAPLRAINGYAKILQEDYATKLDVDGINSLIAIMKNSKRMGELIDDLLAFSRLGRKVVPTSEINMNVLVKSVREDEMIGNSNKIEFEIHELLPAKGQQVLIKQVLVNLISNAIKFSKYKPKTRIEIGSYYKDNLVIYYIKDNGAGFDMQYYDKLFGVFQRLHSQEEFEGTGIGLAIIQKIIQRHNGTVWAESKLNEGSCFYFSLPNINS